MGELMRQAEVLANSKIIPEMFRKKPAEVFIALQYAETLGIPAMSVMQSIYIVHGKPSMSAQFMIACFNSCGRFQSLRYEFQHDEETGKISACRAWTRERETGERLDGPWITRDMVLKEKWAEKQGSKWKSMPDQMYRYRAAAFLIRTVAPELTLGFYQPDEIESGTSSRSSGDRMDESEVAKLFAPKQETQPSGGVIGWSAKLREARATGARNKLIETLAEIDSNESLSSDEVDELAALGVSLLRDMDGVEQ